MDQLPRPDSQLRGCGAGGLLERRGVPGDVPEALPEPREALQDGRGLPGPMLRDRLREGLDRVFL